MKKIINDNRKQALELIELLLKDEEERAVRNRKNEQGGRSDSVGKASSKNEE